MLFIFLITKKVVKSVERGRIEELGISLLLSEKVTELSHHRRSSVYFVFSESRDRESLRRYVRHITCLVKIVLWIMTFLWDWLMWGLLPPSVILDILEKVCITATYNLGTCSYSWTNENQGCLIVDWYDIVICECA